MFYYEANFRTEYFFSGQSYIDLSRKYISIQIAESVMYYRQLNNTSIY